MIYELHFLWGGPSPGKLKTGHAPSNMSKPNANPKTNVGEHILLLTYAALDDIERATGSAKADPCAVQTFSNLEKKSADRCTSVKSRAGYNAEAKEILSKILTATIDELRDAVINDGDSIDVIRKKASDMGPVANFVFRVAEEFKDKVGPTLAIATDKKQWVRGILACDAPELSGSAHLSAVISTGFERFLKALAWMFAQTLPYIAPRTSINHVTVLSTLAQLGLDHGTLEDFKSQLTPRIVKPKAKKTAKKDEKADVEQVAADESEGDDDGIDAL